MDAVGIVWFWDASLLRTCGKLCCLGIKMYSVRMIKAIWFLTGVLYLLGVYFYVVFCHGSYPTGSWFHDVLVLLLPLSLSVTLPVFTLGSFFLLSPVLALVFKFGRIVFFLIESLLRGQEFDLDTYYEKYPRIESVVEESQNDDDYEVVSRFLLFCFSVLMISPIYPVGFLAPTRFYPAAASWNSTLGSQDDNGPLTSYGLSEKSSSNTRRRIRAVVDSSMSLFIEQREGLVRDNRWDKERANRAVAGSWNLIMTMSDMDMRDSDEVSDYILLRLRENP